MTHPLTGEICGEILDFKDFSKYRLHFVEDAMRAAADWQLEQVIKWIEDEIDGLILSCEGISSDRFVDSLKKEFIDDFKKAMRPQEDN